VDAAEVSHSPSGLSTIANARTNPGHCAESACRPDPLTIPATTQPGTGPGPQVATFGGSIVNLNTAFSNNGTNAKPSGGISGFDPATPAPVPLPRRQPPRGPAAA